MGSQGPPFRIAIVGGGIGGLCAALSLHHHCAAEGIKIDVYEQAPQYKEIGAGIGIGVNAARLLHHIGIGDAVNGIAGSREGIWISFRRYNDGTDIVTVPANDRERIRQCPVHRAEFLDLLVDTIKARGAATLHTNKSCIDVIDEGETVTLNFKDGSAVTADLAVGCDGIHSKLRAQFSTDNPRYGGRIAYRGLVPISKLESNWPFQTYSVSWLGKDKHFLVFPISNNRILNIVAFVATEEEKLGGLKESWTATGNKSDLAKDFADFDKTVLEIISHMPEHPSKWVLNDRKPLPQWVFAQGKVVLMGDAAHAMLPHQGAGAGQAIEDGYILGRALQDYLRYRNHTDEDLEKWTRLYQDVRLPRAQRAQATARQAGQVYEMQTDEMLGKSYEECLPLVRDNLQDRMRWVWTEDLDLGYEKARMEVNRSWTSQNIF
ncbi:uncharacterized protein A1O5_09806 [Cladophialophora psammophila CBS 110553]|uniref:FAD-binding domain-containing protein n=1 Tax=Cladophialophora psammophila CBS 110553 TaxID=1182543 RepID=W9X9P2_9EURO|nr:uncharacterized protein A1O5_09806 [Cladophialophora psammophila CBS 110553]EXJ67159.1 hypothetical protein A1O5_09806 [Cladophialophora psammophila CBS 110553]